jgi:hypothetical protein
MEKNIAGWFLMIGGLICLFIIYTMRPPQGFGDAFNMLISGKQNYIREPLYSWLLIIFFAATILGGALLLRDFMKKPKS